MPSSPDMPTYRSQHLQNPILLLESRWDQEREWRRWLTSALLILGGPTVEKQAQFRLPVLILSALLVCVN